jgi:Ca2+-binding EF-hand superfamily protein
LAAGDFSGGLFCAWQSDKTKRDFEVKKAGLAVVIVTIMTASAPLCAQQPIPNRNGSAKQAPTAARAPTAIPARPAPQAVPDMARGDFIKAMDTEFRQRDFDGDGMLTRAEVEQFERKAAYARAQSANRALFNQLDVDRNGVITPGEFAGLVPPQNTLDVSVQMSRLDLNRNQNISLVEYRTVTLGTFDEMDTDKDGVVTDTEYRMSQENKMRAPKGR